MYSDLNIKHLNSYSFHVNIFNFQYIFHQHIMVVANKNIPALCNLTSIKSTSERKKVKTSTIIVHGSVDGIIIVINVCSGIETDGLDNVIVKKYTEIYIFTI